MMSPPKRIREPRNANSPRSVCEHAFVSSQGSPCGRFRKALDAGNLFLIEAAAKELPHIGLADALSILEAFAAADDPRYGRAAARFAARLTRQRGLNLAEAR